MKEKILDAAAQLIARYGLKKFTLDEVAAELRISKKTIYKNFKSKDEIIHAYFTSYTESDKDSIIEALEGNQTIPGKIHSIVYSSHRYKLPISLLKETRQFYSYEWDNIQDLRKFKVKALQKLLKDGVQEGIFKSDIHFGVLSKMLEKISGMFTDYDFLLENRLKSREAIDEALKIIFKGIVKDSSFTKR
ncbi:TetR/AcrR family transcriptional regulator [Clostridium luticellarii]|jgi:AcrR family transcriptional regulator|uniref:TetR/AcrR family transcriptional regulator n=1 Tax=Clostridium luticellarii TaxID=1691940 RepID=UPI002352DE20|nr:TetR/AcrR family transcriptional regulator [Clostridium luticellarii]MCI1944229.1 TetR/AcrR family transcriptional regulator [Clostridium luticellarii]MCI1967731.1 TetR/AcrR family transcriptional regulator [Clostridium luticellarii]MCI1994820.1 TetR/AcrR family transcriptional regulator [Clostridium luticellarii]MCI2039695.1 TetR/AcrR family transcriptional regulator [Clostridium luticellarii]